MATISEALCAICLSLIRLYRLIFSPWVGLRCRFTPTCSQYAMTAFERHGFLKAMGLTLWRIGRCHPFATGGEDPVPDNCCHERLCASETELKYEMKGHERYEF